MAIDWTRGYSAAWRAYRVDPSTWADAETVGGIESLTVERTCDGDAPLLESASLTVSAHGIQQWQEGYVRVAMLATQGGETERVDIATLLCSSASGEAARGGQVLDVDGRSVLWPASVRLLTAGSYAPAGVDAVRLVASMLRACVAAPIVATGSVTLVDPVVFDMGSSVLDAVWLVLRACNLTMRIDGYGTVRVGPEPSEPSIVLDRYGARLMHTSVKQSLDWSGVPNRYYAVDGELVAEAVNADPNSITSTVVRGYAVDVVDTSPVRIGGETLDAYCRRKLAEASTAYDERTYSREYVPGVVPGDIVRASLPTVGLVGDMRIMRQSLTCGAGIVVEEKSRTEVRSWPT